MHPRRVDRYVVKKRSTCLNIVAFGVTRGKPPFVAPPEVDARPVDRVTLGRIVDRLEHGLPHCSAGQDNRRFVELGDDLRNLREESIRYRLSERWLRGMNNCAALVTH